MTLNYEEEVIPDLGFDPESQALLVIEAVLEHLNCPYEAEVNLLMTGEEEIREMNNQFRGIDRSTDVLSFPMNDFRDEGDFSFLEDEETEADAFNPETGELILGDVVINVLRVKEQAKEYGHSFRREFAFLIAHSMLHLCGFDHMSSEEAACMEEKQELILTGMGLTRDCT